RVVPRAIGELEQPLDQRFMSRGVEGAFEVGEEEAPGFDPRVGEPCLREGRKRGRVRQLPDAVHELRRTRLEHSAQPLPVRVISGGGWFAVAGRDRFQWGGGGGWGGGGRGAGGGG